MKRAILSLLVDNKSGVLHKVTGLFGRRGYNIKALSVGETENPAVSRITALTEDNERMLEQICSQVCKLEDVRTAAVLSDSVLMERELALIKVRPDAGEAGSLMRLVADFSARSMAAGDCVVIEASGEPERINRLIELLGEFHIVELSRTGSTALELTGNPLADCDS